MNSKPSALQRVATVSLTDGDVGEGDQRCCLCLRDETAPSASAENQGQEQEQRALRTHLLC